MSISVKSITYLVRVVRTQIDGAVMSVTGFLFEGVVRKFPHGRNFSCKCGLLALTSFAALYNFTPFRRRLPSSESELTPTPTRARI